MATEAATMKNELRLLNLICFVIALVFIALALLNALFSPQFLSTDNLFVTMVCLVMALMFAVNPLLYLKSENKLPIPFKKRLSKPDVAQLPNSGVPLLDARGRAVPPDVRSMMANMGQSRKDL
jgi:hypothetical protein